MTQLPVPVHIGSDSPEAWDNVEERQRRLGDHAAPYLQDMRRPPIARSDLDWTASGFEPRWVGFDTVECSAALQPSIFTGQGADEFDRFRQSAQLRGETALSISTIGSDEAGPITYSVFGPPGDSVPIGGGSHTSINGRRIGKGGRIRVADELGQADVNLALRLHTYTPAPTWHALSLGGAILEYPYGREEHPAEGTLLPILETELGEPVVAVWLSPDGVERRYVVPVEIPWNLLLSWLMEQALPEFVPGALRRARRPLAFDEDSMTRHEREARAALAALEVEYAARREELEVRVADAQEAATTIREGLLYGSGQQLADAVKSALESAGITVVDLDQHLGGPKNADLLCTYGGRSRLVEVKSASGSAPERAYQDLLRHLQEWPHLPGVTPVDGGALVVSHDLRKAPPERHPEPYARPEFLAAQTEPIISALELFAAWREHDMETIRQLLFGPNCRPEAVELSQAGAVDAEILADAPTLTRRRRFWRW